MDQNLHIGTCSWKFPAWRGLVYSGGKGAMTEGDLESLAKERLRKAFEALDGLTEEQLKAVADAVGEQQKSDPRHRSMTG